MKAATAHRVPTAEPRRGGFRPLALISAVIAALLAVSFGAQWYADEVLLLRYCDRPEAALRRLVAIDAGSGVVPGESRRDLMLAARLEYLVPRGVGEPVDAYVGRVRKVLAIRCGAGILGKESLYILLA